MVAKTRRAASRLSTKPTLKERVQDACRHVWCQISGDVDWEIDLDGAVELCLDADRPVSFDCLSREDYKALLDLPIEVQNEWGREALRGYL